MEKYKNEEWLHREYVKNGRTLKNIAEECGCTFQNISYYCDKFDIDTRDTGDPTYPPNHRFHPQYDCEEIRTVVDGTQHTIQVHRLIAVAIYGFDTVTESDDIHHKSGHGLDNRHENLIPLSRSQHLRIHRSDSTDVDGASDDIPERKQ